MSSIEARNRRMQFRPVQTTGYAPSAFFVRLLNGIEDAQMVRTPSFPFICFPRRTHLPGS
jgi:hypothetical protein